MKKLDCFDYYSIQYHDNENITVGGRSENQKKNRIETDEQIYRVYKFSTIE